VGGVGNTAGGGGGGIYASGPLSMNADLVWGNTAGVGGGGQGGALFVSDGPTTVAYSAFLHNTDTGGDNPAGVFVAPEGPNNHPSFTTTHSIFG
jgi:hypothetical protein